jgi:hypothetical protein
MKYLPAFLRWPGFWVVTFGLLSLVLLLWSIDWSDKGLKQVGFDLGLAILVSLLVYVLLAWWPERRKKNALRSYLNTQHEELVGELIPLYLWAIGHELSSDMERDLKNPLKFREFFKQRFNQSQDRWHAVANELQSNSARLTSVLVALKRFQTELDVCVTLSAVNIEDGGFERLRTLSQILKRTREQAVLSEYDGIKQLCAFLWTLHTGWSFVHGYTKVDHVKKSISESF